MAKISRPIVYTLVGALGVYAWFLSTQNNTTATHRRRLISQAAQMPDANGILPSDYTVHFPRYSASKRDPFVPKVLGDTDVLGEGSNGGWALTGINVVNGVRTAVVENNATNGTSNSSPGVSDATSTGVAADETNDCAFLKAGDRWKGLTVLSVAPDSVTFENEAGQETHLAFPLEAAVPSPGVPAASTADTAPAASDAGASTVLGPNNVPVLPGISGFGRGRFGGGYGGGGDQSNAGQ